MGGRAKLVFATCATLLVALVLAPGSSAAAQGETTEGTVVSGGSEFRYLMYTPESYSARRSVPLLVVVHGCGTTAEQEQAISRYDEIAERDRFVVLYVDVDETARNLPGPLRHCWKFWDPSSIDRGSGDPAAIVKMTRAAMAERSIDPERVYLAGISAGGLMTSIAAAVYPDLYAASAVMSSAAFADAPCFTSGVGQPAESSALLAHQAMGPRARVVPTFVLGGDADLAFPWSCTSKALEQSLRTNNLVLSGEQTGPLSLDPAAVDKRRKPGGHEYTVRTYEDPDGCLVGESWQIHEMGHFWSGGTTDPEYSGYNDTKGPSAAKATWAFFERFRRSDTGMPCAESAKPACPKRKVTVKLRKRLQPRSVRAKVSGERAKAKLRGRRVVVTIPAGADKRVRVRLRVKREGDLPTRVVRRSFQRCAPG